MREGVSRGDSCSQYKDSVGKVVKPPSQGVTFCLGNVTAAREGERGGEIPSYARWDRPAN